MIECPNDDRLRQFVADALPPPESGPIEVHLDACDRCRQRLDEIANVGSLSAVLSSSSTRLRAESPSLLLAMESLRAEPGVAAMNASPTPADPTPSTPTIILPPSARDGFIGKLGEIDIRRLIGRGGMGIVYEGIDPVLKRTVAVKVLSPHLLGDSSARDRFVREAQAVAALSHENVVAIHEIDETAGNPYLVLQFVAGESLAERLARDGKLAVDEAARIGAQIAHGLAAAHAVGLVHRDVKPGNILIEAETGHIRITDFGLARAVGGEAITGAGVLPGTPAYMSPEQVTGQAVDSRADLFSLGVLLYQCVTGELPFAGDSPFVILDKIRSEKPAPFPPALPRWFCSIVDRLLEKDPNHRLGSALAVAQALEQHAVVPSARSRWSRNVILAVASIVILALAATTWSLLPTPNVPVPPIADGTKSPPVQVTGIKIAGREVLFQTIAAAIDEAADGDTIEVHGDGPFRSTKIEINDKRLTIRAAPGSRPMFVPDDTSSPPLQWIVTDSDLNIVGLDIDWPTNAKLAEGFSKSDGVIVGEGKLQVIDSRIISGNRTSCLVAGGTLTVDGCHLITDRAGGRCILWKAMGALKVTQTAMEGKTAIVIGSTATQPPMPAEIDACTFRSDIAVMFAVGTSFATPLPLSIRRSLIDAEHIATLYYTSGFPTKKKNLGHQETKAVLRKMTSWTESENVYRRKAVFLVSWAPFRPRFPADINGLADWTAFWQLPDAVSIEGDLIFESRSDKLRPFPRPRLERIDNPSGPIPSAVGISSDTKTYAPK